MPSRNSLGQTASFVPQIHLHLFLDNELDCICHPTLHLEIATWLVLINLMWLSLAREFKQLDAYSNWENGDTRLLKPGSLNYFVQHSYHLPAIPIYAGLFFVFLIRNIAIMSYNESLGKVIRIAA